MSTSPFASSQQRWSAVVSRNPDAVGAFVYAVKTTRIYCKPDCKARLARQANVNFYDSGPLAEEAGFRACKRCKPELIASQQEDPLLAKIRHAVYLVEGSASRGIKISLGALSSEVGLSKWHLQRVFTKLQGISPNQLSNSILSTLESDSEGSRRSMAGGTDSDAPTPNRQSPDEYSLSSDTYDIEADPQAWAESDNTEVEDVLKELFPELFTNTPAWPGIWDGAIMSNSLISQQDDTYLDM